MLLTGTYPRTLDEKNRVAIPSKLRNAIVADDPEATGLFVGLGQDGCVALYPPSQFRRLARKLDRASYTARDPRRFRRLYFAQAEESAWDKQGRILIPEKLFARARIPAEKKPRDVVLVGVQRHLEVWNPDQWQIFCCAAEAEFDEIAEGALAEAPRVVKRITGDVRSAPDTDQT